jgi:hypothetical protein
VSSPEESRRDQTNRTDSETSTSISKPPGTPLPPPPPPPPWVGKKRLAEEELDESLVKEYKERIDKFMVQFRAASENGLFYGYGGRRREFGKKRGN